MNNGDICTSRIHLYATPSFMRGIARLVDPLGLLDTYNISSTPEQADYQAVLSDWMSVGDDIACAITEYGKSLKQES
jgi:hypothetical protein